MKLLIIVAMLFALVGCSENAAGPTNHHDAGTDDVEEDGDDVVNDDVGEDVDVEPGECDDSPCEAQLAHPECETATCDEIDGCSLEPIREGFDCETDTDELRVIDGVCEAGVCVGTVCECDAETECCDGCEPINDGQSCDDGDSGTGAEACQAGVCVGEPCECSEGECCDGCHLLPEDTACGEDDAADILICVSDTKYRRGTIHKGCSGQSPECGSDNLLIVEDNETEYSCPSGENCQSYESGAGYCD